MASIPTQEEFLAATRRSQEAMTAAIKAWLETVRTATPKLTSVYAPLTGRLPKLPLVSLPFADKLPTPEEAVDNAYHMAGQLLANQRKFTEDVLKAMAPLMPGRGEAGPKGNGPSEPEVPGHRVWQEAVAEPEPVAVSQPQPVAVSKPETVATAAEPEAPVRPAAKSTAARSAPKTTAPAARSTAPRTTSAKGTAARSASARSASARSASARSASAKSTPDTAPASRAPKGPEAS